VLLKFNGLSWPHITVATLKKNVPVIPPIWKVDPDIPLKVIGEIRPPIPPELGAPIRTIEPGKPSRQFEEEFEAEERKRAKQPTHKPEPRTRPKGK
jgi:hypothetical protein